MLAVMQMHQMGTVQSRAADLDHGRPKELVAQFETLPELCQHCAIWNIIIGLLHDGVMKSGVEWVTHPRGGLHP